MTDNANSNNPPPVSSEFHILIIDDNEPLCKSLLKIITRMGMTAAYEITLHDGLKTASAREFDVIFLDVNLPDGCGLDILPKLRTGVLPPEIIMITGCGDERGAETAIQNEAWDYISKDASFQSLKLSLMRATQYRKQKKSVSHRAAIKRDGIIGNGPLVTACLEQVGKAAATGSPVLILGETGTGKEIFARAIHENSPRSKKDFVVVDCSALPEHLVESTLFGHKRGAFTGADSDRTGLVEQANLGTLFLDEIGELPLDIQKKFLRVLQEKCFRPVGGKHEVESDFRLICATHRNLSEMVETGSFRQDLYFRIRGIAIQLPPLSARPEDIPDLALFQMKRNARLSGGTVHRMSPDFLEALNAYHWPGNIRELFNVIDGVHAETADEPELFARHLPVHIRTRITRLKIKPAESPPCEALPSSAPTDCLRKPLNEFIEAMKLQYIRELMARTQGNVPEACRISGLSRGYLYTLLKKFHLL